jgi:hypothetical protein
MFAETITPMRTRLVASAIAATSDQQGLRPVPGAVAGRTPRAGLERTKAQDPQLTSCLALGLD